MQNRRTVQKKNKVNFLSKVRKGVYVIVAFLLSLVILITVFYFTRDTKAAAGDFAIYREAGGLETVTTTLTDQAWDTTVSEAGLFSIDGTDTTVTLSEAGHYLALYNLGIQVTTGTQKGSTHGFLDVNGSQSPYGRSSCYIENQTGQTKCWMSGAAIIATAATNETLKVQAQRKDDNTLSLRRMSGESGFTILRLDDDWEYARIREAGGGQAFNSATWATVTLDTEDELDAGYSHAAGVVTLADPARYLVTTNVEFYSTAGAKNRLNATRLTLDGAEVNGTRVTALMTGDNSSVYSVASYVGIIETTATNQVLTLEGSCIGETCSKVTNTANQTGITIVKLPSTVEVVGVTEAGGGQQVDTTSDPITWDTNSFIDTAAFSHSTSLNTSQVTVLQDDDYLFLSTFYNSHNTPATVILDPHWEWRVNGSTLLPYGSFSYVNRGDDSTNGAWHSGASGGAIFTSLTTNDYVEVVNTEESTGTYTDPTFQANLMGLQGLRISTLEEPDITVSASGTQQTTVTIPTADAYLGGAFVLTANNSFPTETVESITITENGTVDAQNDLSNIRLFYDLSTTTPYDCSTETYDGTEEQYGATASAFSAANGSATFTDSVVASSTQTICVYVVLDVDDTASVGETIEVEITDPSTDVVLGGGPVGPNTAVLLDGTTTLQDDKLTQIHYHWRNDDDTEALATSATGGTEDTVLSDLPKNNEKRLRFEVSNEGTISSPATQFLLEYATRTTSCAAVSSGWTDVGIAGGAWDLFDSSNLTDSDDTTNIALATGGVTDENTTFLTPNGGVKDTSSLTSAITLTSTEFVELEYSIIATDVAYDGESYCFRVTDNGTPLPDYQVYPEVSIAADVLVSGLGSHTATVAASTSDFYIGGSWSVVDQSGSRDVTSITLNETGSVDALNDISNIRLFYELDTSVPYDCSTETYDGTEEQYGATSSAFSAADGTATFSETVGISTTETLCLYAVVDIDGTASDGDTLALEISNPGTEVVVSTGSVNPNVPVGPTGSTTIQKAVLEQSHYHWRNDDGTEASATSATGGAEDTAITNVKKTETQRLRLEVSNEGGTSTDPSTYTLQYAESSGSCSASTGWVTVGAVGGAWAMSDSVNLTDGNDTTNIALATGGVTDENTTFLTPNGGVLDLYATSSILTLLNSHFLELEYGIEATSYADFGTTYCFRVLGDGTDVTTYASYPQATIRQNQDFYIQRGSTNIPNSVSSVTIAAGTDYIAPSDASKAFIRITNTMHTGAGATTGGGAQNADSVTTYISDPENITSSVTFSRTGTSNSTQIYWEIIEYTGPVGGDNEMVVRGVQSYTTGAKSLTENIAVTGVTDDNDVVVFLTGQSTPEAATTEYETGLFTTDWDGTAGEVILERNSFGSGAGNAAQVSFAVVEFTGSNWKTQRTEHTYNAVGTTETGTISTVNDVSRAFLHTQHRTDQGTVADYGHLVWLSGASTVSFALNTQASSPTTHTSVAWVIENTQTNGIPMAVTRSNGSQTSGGVEPSIYSIAIGKTLDDIDVSSIFTTMYSNGADLVHPHAIMGATIASTTHYELWISDTGSSRAYRTEIVEWPTATLAVRQNYYRFYVDNDALDPTDAWPAGAVDLGENAAITGLDTPPSSGEHLRLRMSLNVSGANFSAGQGQAKLQYGVRETSCGAIAMWHDMGDIGSSTAVWRGYDGTPVDGTALSTNPPTAGDLNLSVSDIAGTYEEENLTVANPYKIYIGDDVEYDWHLEANDVTDLTSYCFRMAWSDDAPMDEYLYYPTVTMAGFEVEQQDWRWYNDETSITPTVALAASNTAPVNIAYGDPLKLRILLEEIAGRDGQNAKYKLQWSEYSDFSVVTDVEDMDTCAVGSEWCYFDGAGTEGATITDSVLEGADSCVASVGSGCGTHNEMPYAPDIVGEVGTTSTDSVGTTVTLQHTYDDPVFIVESIGGDATGDTANAPAVAVITATTTSSFTVRIQEPDNEADDHGEELVGYFVMERGAYQLPDGRRIDADTMDTAQYYGNAVSGATDDTCSFTQTFSTVPVVLAALQSNNNVSIPDFLTVSKALITVDDFACSLEVPDGETNTPTDSETIGWIALDGGVFANNGIALEATTTSESVTGWTDTPWYEQLFTQLFTGGPGIVATKQTRNGAEGGWVRYDNEDFNSVQMAIDERDDGERTHTTERIGYIAFAESGVLYRTGTSNFTFSATAVTEFEFTLVHNNARPNVTYFFRLYDVNSDEAVATSTTSVYPSLSTEGASLSFSIGGVDSGVTTEGFAMDVTTTATSVPFGSLSLGVPKNAAQRLTVSTNATEGYQVLAYEQQNLISGGGTIEDVSGTNAAPTAWSVGCPAGATSCYGYHAGDNTMEGGSNRFLLDDTFAAFTGIMEEVAYSSGPALNESTDIIYRVEVGAGQPAGRYQSKVTYIIVPVF